jgi:hypothetical protein
LSKCAAFGTIRFQIEEAPLSIVIHSLQRVAVGDQHAGGADLGFVVVSKIHKKCPSHVVSGDKIFHTDRRLAFSFDPLSDALAETAKPLVPKEGEIREGVVRSLVPNAFRFDKDRFAFLSGDRGRKAHEGCEPREQQGDANAVGLHLNGYSPVFLPTVCSS